MPFFAISGGALRPAGVRIRATEPLETTNRAIWRGRRKGDNRQGRHAPSSSSTRGGASLQSRFSRTS
jgi:hypothetical protein